LIFGLKYNLTVVKVGSSHFQFLLAFCSFGFVIAVAFVFPVVVLSSIVFVLSNFSFLVHEDKHKKQS